VRRSVAFSLVAAVVVFVLAVLMWIEIRRPAMWQDQLTGYLARQNAEGDAVHLLVARRALAPQLFEGDLSQGVRGTGSYTTRSLPYPPDRLYCVLLEHRYQQASSRRQLVFVALHSDLYTADWVLHEGPYEPFGPKTAATLRTLGCAGVLDAGQ
jgi:hypothetical protein